MSTTLPGITPTLTPWATQLEPIQYSERSDGLSAPRTFTCPDYGHDGRLRTCKRRGCPRCGPAWARDWQRLNTLNLEHYGGPVVMVTITAPGEDLLPWDEAHCAHRRAHKHRGPAGCRVQQRAARDWSESITYRWAQLRDAARMATRRKLASPSGELGPAPAILERAYEPQKRGVPHLHVVLGYRTREEQDAAHVFVGELKRLAADYVFGFADAKGKKPRSHARPVIERHGVELRPMTGKDVALYLANYLTGRNSKKKSSIRENIADPVMPRSLIWLTPALSSTSTATQIERQRDRIGVPCGTGVTMRWLRKARHVWAAMEGRVEAPNWTCTGDAVQAVSVFLQAFRRRPPPEDLTPALQFAAKVDRRVKWEGRWPQFQRQVLELAFQLVEQCIPAPEAAAA